MKKFLKNSWVLCAAAVIACSADVCKVSAVTALKQSDGYSIFSRSVSEKSVFAALTNCVKADLYAQVSIYCYDEDGGYIDNTVKEGVLGDSRRFKITWYPSGVSYKMYGRLYSSDKPVGEPLSEWEWEWQPDTSEEQQ